MKYVFTPEILEGNELLFWICTILIIFILILTMIFIKKEIKNGTK